MADDPTETENTTKKSKLPLVIGLLLALVGGGSGFYATFSGMILNADDKASKDSQSPIVSGPDLEYVAVEPLVISLRKPSNSKHLKFRAHLEVHAEAKEDVERILPRIVDVLNNYLRAVEPADFEDATALIRVRSQMLRRIQVVAGEDKVNDLLIMEFVLT